ncbi:Uncharacterised protein [Mycobacteroides abscessus subsp. massiliense]|nr:Uncharacterised protein [Mycobacteroides abscessus subsp. massiliense]SLI60042.1 Uncharacterised protein [Mycobacteroides abscessus subsp. massiliense]
MGNNERIAEAGGFSLAGCCAAVTPRVGIVKLRGCTPVILCVRLLR